MFSSDSVVSALCQVNGVSKRGRATMFSASDISTKATYMLIIFLSLFTSFTYSAGCYFQ